MRFLKMKKAEGFSSFFFAALLLLPDKGVSIGFKCLNSKAVLLFCEYIIGSRWASLRDVIDPVFQRGKH